MRLISAGSLVRAQSGPLFPKPKIDFPISLEMKKKAVKRTAIIAVLACSVAAASAAENTPLGAQTAEKFGAATPRTIRLEYLLFLPGKYNEDPRRRWPLILYLHGGSLRGDDANKLCTLGLPHRLEQDRQFPFVVITPLCPEGEIWPIKDSEELVHAIKQSGGHPRFTSLAYRDHFILDLYDKERGF